MDRRVALASGKPLTSRTRGVALFADVVGFTPLAEALARKFGHSAGAEELTKHLSALFGAVISEVHRYQGSVINLSGDGLTCWFDGDDTRRATACGLAMQRAMTQFESVELSTGGAVSLAMKVGLAAGPVRRFRVGNPLIQYLDVLAGTTLDRLAEAERMAGQGEVVLDPGSIADLADKIVVAEWRTGLQNNRAAGPRRFAVVADLIDPVEVTPWSTDPGRQGAARDEWRLTEAQIRPWLLPPVYRRLRSGQSSFLDEIRPAAALFLSFSGLDFDNDISAGEKLDSFVQWVQSILARYAGYLIQLTTGDKGNYLYAAFGAPVAYEDFTDRALAVSMVLRSPPAELGFIKKVRIGLSQGLMYAGTYGSPARQTYGVLGHETNVAARLMTRSNPGQILVTGRVVQNTGQSYQIKTLPPIGLKGKSEPVPVFELLGRRWTVVDSQEPRHRASMVGRSTERARLEKTLQAVLDDGAGRVLIIEGEAGIGKSRLVEELIALVKEQGLSGLVGAGHGIERHTPYRAWRDIFTTFFNLDDDSGGTTSGREMVPTEISRQRRVRNRLQAVAPDQGDRLPLLNDVLDLGLPDTVLTASLEPATRQRSLVSLLVTLLRAWSRDQPLILVLEDAHWLDSLSWELALHVARALVASGDTLLLVVVTRPIEEDTTPARHIAKLRALAETRTILLSTLNREEITALVTARLGLAPRNLPEPVADLIGRRAGGNPFFAGELVLALQEQGVIAIESDDHNLHDTENNGFSNRCVIKGDLARASRTLPGTLKSLILGRIDRLSPGPQLTLKVGAVIGRSFGFTPLYHTLSRYVSLSKPSLKAHLSILTGSSLTSIESLLPDLTYGFNHVMTQQVAYQTLLRQQRRKLHRAIAEWYEDTYHKNTELASDSQSHGSSSIVPLLVHHFRYAEEHARERHFAQLAGAQAAAQFANEEAVAYYNRALELTLESDYAGRYILLLAREKVQGLQGQRDAQLLALQTLNELARSLNDDLKRAEVGLQQSDLAEATGDYAAAIEAAGSAIELARSAGSAKMEARGYLAWGRALWRQGKYEVAQHRLMRSLQLTSGSPDQEAHCLRILGLIVWSQGNYGEARRYFEQTLLTFQQIGDRRGEGLVFNNLAIISVEEGDYAQAIAYFEQSLLICRLIGDLEVEGKVLNNLGVVAGRQSNYVTAQNQYERALLIMREIGDRQGQAMVLDNLGDVFRYQGDYARAKSYFDQSLYIRREIGERRGEANILNNLGNIFHYLGDYNRARRYYRQALVIRREIGERQGEGETLAYLSLLFHHLGDNQIAREYSAQSLRIADDLGDHHLKGFALTHLGHALTAQEQLAEAKVAYREAVAIRQNLGEYNRSMEPLAGLIRICLIEDEQAAAQLHVEEILNHLEEQDLQGTEEPVRIYLTCYRSLAGGQDPRALDILERTHDLLRSRVSKLEDVRLRRSFFANVAAHRDVVTEWARLKQNRPAGSSKIVA
jgi:class 3 adenylate cyclase/tetratricopeptide (TPR) repeat protein